MNPSNTELEALLRESLRGIESAPKGQRMELGVLDTAEFRRIKSLPRRGEVPPDLVAIMTAYLRTETGTMVLREKQALALLEMHDNNGAFLPKGVGSGKTIDSLLAARVLDAQRPILVVPAALIEKTKRQAATYMQHWQIPRHLRILSYQILGRESGAHLLDRYDPDLIILDECHRAKNKKAAVTKRLSRRFKSHPKTKCVALSGTISKRSLHDYAHIIAWCLKENAPLPSDWNELEAWASCIDERPRALQRYRPGALMQLSSPEDHENASDEFSIARRAYRRRLIETPGVVATVEQGCDASLLIKGQLIETDPIMEPHWTRLRSMWELPDGWPLADGMQVWAKAQELSLGFFYKAHPRPPADWMAAKKAWSSFVREVLKDNRRNLDSELQVARACATHPEWYGDEEYRIWRAIKDTFTYNQVIEWIDDTAAQACIDWLNAHHGLLWVQHTQFGETIAQLTGIPYFGQKGMTSDGRYVEDHDGPAILSVGSNKEGRNLQYKANWTKSLVAGWPPNGLISEQMLGRTHRDGQTADEVHFHTLVACYEHYQNFAQCLLDAQYLADTSGPQKLLIADVDMPDIFNKRGDAWTK